MTIQTLHNKSRADRDVIDYLHRQEQKDILRFITCGSVDDGKSTLIGRLLHDTKMVFDDQLLALKKDSKSLGTTGGQADLALLVDGLQSEREQGITIDVAYRYFTSEKRKFIIADTPGHEQYTRNMATGASAAQLAVLLVDARYGVQQQTRRHSYICALLGIKQFIVAINKMDLVGYRREVFEKIRADFQAFSRNLNVPDTRFVPLSALAGDNVVSASDNMPWYSDGTLMSLLETVQVHSDRDTDAVRLPVQYVNRPNLNFRGYCGTLACGTVAPGQSITVLPSGNTSTIKSVLSGDRAVDAAHTGEAITITLEDDIDISRGDLIVGANEQVAMGSEFDADIVWMHESALQPGRQYDFKIGAVYTSGTIAAIDSQVDINTLECTAADKLELNGIGEARIRLTQDVVYDLYRQNSVTGSFIIIDRLSNLTVGAGMISRSVQQTGSAANDDNHYTDNPAGIVTPQMRSALKLHTGKCIWLESTGFGSTLEYALHRRGLHTWLLNTALYDAQTVAVLVNAMLDAGLVVIVEGSGSSPANVESTLPPHQWMTTDSSAPVEEVIEAALSFCRA